MPVPPREPSPRHPSGKTYVLTITLRRVDPPIWRKLVVPADLRLDQLHRVFQIAMGWEDYHLHAFRIGDRIYGPAAENDVDEWVDEETVRLADVTKPETEFIYEYDLGDGWQHSVKVEDERGGTAPDRTLVCLDGARCCPPEDCGGPHEYTRLLEALADPSHERHDELLDWVGGNFDAEAFDLELINVDLLEVV